MKKMILKTVLFIILGFALNSVVFAYSIPAEYTPINTPFGTSYGDIYEGKSTSTAVTILQILAGGLLYFAAPIAVLMIATSAFNMVMNGANSEKVEEAKKHLLWTILGLVTIMLSYTIVKVILNNAQMLGGGASGG